MTPFTRATAQAFRVLLARCISGRPRGPAPPVLVVVKEDTRTVASTTAEG